MNFKRLTFSNFLMGKSDGKKIAILSMLTAFNIVSNAFFEFKTLDVQFSFTIVISILTGIICGPFSGFLVCFFADLIGFFISSWGLVYMPWVGISTATTSLIAGMFFIDGKMKNFIFKIVGISILSFLICTVLINSTGFYYYNKTMGFSTAILEYVSNKFNGDINYFIYLAYRLIFKLQIVNCVFNYVISFLLVPILKRLKIIV